MVDGKTSVEESTVAVQGTAQLRPICLVATLMSLATAGRVHCLLPVRRSIIPFLLWPACRVHVDALWEARNMEARSPTKLTNVRNTLDFLDDVSHTALAC